MKVTIDEALKKAVSAHKLGELNIAENLYQAILKSQPTHPDANHNLGVLAVSVNNAAAALPFLKNAVEASPKTEQFWLSYIKVLIQEKHIENANKC